MAGTPLGGSMAATREHLKQMDAVASKWAKWKPGVEVLTKVRSVPTIFPQLDVMLRVGGWPIERFALVHGRSNEGKTVLLHGIGKSFLMGGHFYAYVDAEFSTPADWIRTMLSEFAEHPGFRALRPSNYEETVDQVREFCTVIGDAKAHGQLDSATSGFIVIDSLRKLVPKDMLAKIMKGVEQTEDEPVKGRKANKRNAKRGVDGAGGRAAMIKAAMNAAWFDEVIPLLAQTGTAMAVVARESENVDAGMWGEDFHVQGGKSPYYESSVALRVMRDSWVRETDEKSPIIGERHVLEQRKTKVGAKIASAYVRPRCYFHTSNGALTPPGFDRARDVIELAVESDVVTLSGSWYGFGKKRLGQGLNKSVVRLTSDPELLAEVEAAARETATKQQDAQNGGAK